MENTGFLVLLERGRAEGNWRPHFPLSHSLAQSMMAGSPVFLGIIVLLSAFLAPSVGGRAMPKLADRKLCADEECSCKTWGLGGLGSLGCQPVWRVVIPFCSFPRPHLHGCGPSGLRGPRLPFPDHTQGPSCVCLLQAEGPGAALLGRQCESWENRKRKDTGLGWECILVFHPKGKFEGVD